jgi:hypothetical protein
MTNTCGIDGVGDGAGVLVSVGRSDATLATLVPGSDEGDVAAGGVHAITNVAANETST